MTKVDEMKMVGTEQEVETAEEKVSDCKEEMEEGTERVCTPMVEELEDHVEEEQVDDEWMEESSQLRQNRPHSHLKCFVGGSFLPLELAFPLP